MKIRTLLTVVLVIAGLITVSAQKEKHFEIGAQFGYGSHWIINQNNYGLPELDYDYFWGSGYNFQAGYNFNQDMGIFVEIGVTNQGQKYKDDNYTHAVDGLTIRFDDVKRNIDLKYLNVPIFFKYSVGEGVGRFRLLVGPQFSFLQGAEQTYVGDGTDFADIPSYQNWEMSNGKIVNVGEKEIEDRYNTMDISFVLDLGADIYVMDEILYLSAAARMYYGFMDINASDYQVKNSDNNYDPSHNAGVGFYFGVHYIIGSKKEE